MTDWVMLKPMILGALMEHFATSQPIVNAAAVAQSKAALEDEDPIIQQIKILLEERVRPAVMQDGGDIVFQRFEDGVFWKCRARVRAVPALR